MLNTKQLLAIGAASGVVLATIILLLFWFIWLQKRKKRKKNENGWCVALPPTCVGLHVLKQQTAATPNTTTQKSDDESSESQDNLLNEEGKTEERKRKISFVPKPPPRIDFHLLFTNRNNTFTVHVQHITGLPIKYKNVPTYVKIVLYYNTKKYVFYGQSRGKSMNPVYSQNFTFTEVDWDILLKAVLIFYLFAKKVKQKLIAVLDIPLQEMDLKLNLPTSYSKEIILLKKSPKNKEMVEETGAVLVVGLKYFASTQQVKVTIQRVENLIDKRLIPPKYYIIANMYLGNAVITSKETQVITGPHLVWNESIFFKVAYEQLYFYWLQLLLVHIPVYRKQDVIGNISIGPPAGGQGHLHWTAMIESKDKQEIVERHPIKV